MSNRPSGWLPPSVQSKCDHHIRIISRYAEALPPGTRVVIEIGRFDMAHMLNPEIHGEEYQQGPLYEYENKKAYLLKLYDYKCPICGKKFGSKRTDGTTVKACMHHVLYRSKGSSDNVSVLIPVCDHCHTAEAHQEGGALDKLRKIAEKQKSCIRGLRDAAMMNIAAKRLKAAFPNACYTYGNITHADREAIHLEKSHANDAVAIAKHLDIRFFGDYTIHDCDYTALYRQVRKKKRSHALMITGRKDASQGNFRFSYNTETRELIYRSQQMKNGEPILMHLKNVVFPYKQEFVDWAVGLPTHARHAVSWRIIETGGSFLIQCIVTIPEKNMVEFIGDGCIGMDTNYDNLSISETDRSGNILRHKIIRFDLEGASSGHAEQILSSALDEVYQWCRESAKPLVMEDLKLKHTANRYGSKKRNFVTSRFAYSTVTALAESKSYKYGIALNKVHPAYTSQAGKLIFMKRYGMSIHEGASAAIARRGMGIQEKVPLLIKVIDPSINWNQPRRQQWAAAYKITKQLRASEMYALTI